MYQDHQGEINKYINVDYDEYETQQINALKQALELKLFSENLKPSTLLKMLVVAEYDVDKAVENCIQHTLFLKNYKKQNFTTELQKGTIYTCGFDKQQRPVIIIQDFISIYIIAYYLETVKRNLLVDYYVENWTIILDLDKDLPTLQIEELLFMQLNFCGNLNKILIINSPIDIQKIVTQFYEKFKYLKAKVKIIDDQADLLMYIPKDQLEQKYGGDKADLTIFWPIIKREKPKLFSPMPSGSNLSIAISEHSPRKSSMMKIVVLEENGNALVDQQVEVEDYKTEKDFKTEKDYKTEKDKMTLKSTTFQRPQMDEVNILKKQKLHKFGDTKSNTFTQRQTIMEGESPHSNGQCCSRGCIIF
ncbi:hypothetical protein pb186bvf_008203 [Paramecium bursaria]